MTKTDVGEYVVGAYLKVVENCDFVNYNVRPPGGGLEGLRELDVVGLKFLDRAAYICEATTHIRGLNYGKSDKTFEKIENKHKAQRIYAKKHLPGFPNTRFMLWSPVVPKGIAKRLEGIKDLDLIINEKYIDCILELRKKMRRKKITQDVGNPFFRTLQILEFSKFFKLLEEQRNTQEQVSP